MAPESTLRTEVLFEGRVQGVGFRYTAQSIAKGYDVVGYVQNLPDGRVKLVAEGARHQIDRFLDDLAGRMEDHIQDQHRSDGPATGEFSQFGVRH